MKRSYLLLIVSLFLITSCGEESSSDTTKESINNTEGNSTTLKSDNQILLEGIIENYETFDIYSFTSTQTSRFGASVGIDSLDIEVNEIFTSTIMYDLSKLLDLYYFTSVSSYTPSSQTYSLKDQKQIIKNDLSIDNPYIQETLRIISATNINETNSEYISSEEALTTILKENDSVYETYYIGSYDLSIFDDCQIVTNSDGSLLISGEFEAKTYANDLSKTKVDLELVFNKYGYLVSASGNGKLAIGEGYVILDMENFYNSEIEHINRIG